MTPFSVLQAMLRVLKTRYRVLVPLMVLGIARYVHHQQHKRHVEPTHGGIDLDALHADHDYKPVEEWHDIVDGVQMQSVVYGPADSSVSNTPDANLLVLVVPGNPGIPHFYVPLMREIASRHGFQHEVRCLSHTGHFMPWKNHGQAFSLDDQHAHKLAYVQHRLEENPALRLVVIGHSIGGYLTLQILKAFPDRVEKLVLMQPTIKHIGKSPKGTQLMPLFRNYPWAVRLVAFVEYLIPISLRKWIVHHAIGGHATEPLLHHAALSLVNANVMENVLKMAYHEMHQVTDLDEDLIRQHEDKMLFVYSHVDEWVPDAFAREFATKFPTAKHTYIPQSHAFMMDENGTETMADHIVEWMASTEEVEQREAEEEQVRRPLTKKPSVDARLYQQMANAH